MTNSCQTLLPDACETAQDSVLHKGEFRPSSRHKINIYKLQTLMDFLNPKLGVEVTPLSADVFSSARCGFDALQRCQPLTDDFTSRLTIMSRLQGLWTRGLQNIVTDVAKLRTMFEIRNSTNIARAYSYNRGSSSPCVTRETLHTRQLSQSPCRDHKDHLMHRPWQHLAAYQAFFPTSQYVE